MPYNTGMNTDTLLTEHGIDAKLTRRLIQQANAQETQGSIFQDFPEIDGEQVISTSGLTGITLSRKEFTSFLGTLLPEFSREDFRPPSEGDALFLYSFGYNQLIQLL